LRKCSERISTRFAPTEALELVDEGFEAIKVRLGRKDATADLATVRAIRKAIPGDIAIMGDFNQALDLAEARKRCRQLDDEGLCWIEEPIAHDEYAGCAQLARETRTPIQIGENFAGPRAMALALKNDASDFVMPDLERIGGVTGWMSAAALADAARIPMSSHLFHEVSAHLLAATPTAAWIEYVDWADAILESPLRPVDGYVTAPTRPGTGMTWNADAVARFRQS
jgi:mandelate racemase